VTTGARERVSAFTSANIDKILALKPDLVLTFSNLQADIVANLIRRGLDVHAFNQRSIAGILDMIRTLGAMVDAIERARQLVGMLETRLGEVRSRAESSCCSAATPSKAAPALEGIAECRLAFDPFRLGVDIGEADIDVFSPVRDQTPA
jgi:hypothetical protein